MSCRMVLKLDVAYLPCLSCWGGVWDGGLVVGVVVVPRLRISRTLNPDEEEEDVDVDVWVGFIVFDAAAAAAAAAAVAAASIIFISMNL